MKSGRLAVSALNNSISNEGENIKLNLGTKQELDTAEKRIKALERINKSLREQMRLTPEGKADPGTLRRAAKHLMQEYGGSWSQKEMEAKLQEIYQVQKEHRPQAAQEKTQRLASELVRNYLDNTTQDNTAPAEPASAGMRPPTVEEVRGYCAQIRSSVDPERFVDHYTSTGWMSGGTPIRDWRARVRMWEK